MFQKACSVIEPCLVQVGGATPDGGANLHGTGCLLSALHVLTACHVVQEAKAKYGTIAISKYDGLFKAEVMASSSKADIAVLQTTDKLQDASLPKPTAWPDFQEDFKPRRGMSLGYLSFLRKNDPGGIPRTCVFFSGGHVAYLARDKQDNPRWTLDHGFSESGFSGSPVFTPDGTIVGVSVITLLMGTVIEGLPSVSMSFPQFSTIIKVGEPTGGIVQAQRQKGA